MLLPVRTQGNRRIRVQSSNRAETSHVSLLSHLTTDTTGSGGSSSTITQESFDRSIRGNASGESAKRSRRKRRDKKSERMASSRRSQEAVDVFAFLESPSRYRHPRYKASGRRESSGSHEESDRESVARSQHSDSGISMNDSLTDGRGPDTFHKTRLASLPEKDDLPKQQHQTLMFDRSGPVYGVMSPWVSTGATFQPQFPPTPISHHGSQFVQFAQTLDSSLAGDQSPLPSAVHERGPRSTLSGYDLLASAIRTRSTVDGLAPLYRRFSRLGHRILLQLQDEIVEMETDLTLLDAEDARLRSQDPSIPASRRVNWAYQQSPLHARRLDLLGKINVKMQQYGEAIALHQRLAQSTGPAQSTEIQQYRAWLDEKCPLSSPEMRFLDDDEDVICLQNSTLTVKEDYQWIPLIGVSLSTVGLLMFFKMVSGVTWRLAAVGHFCGLWIWLRQQHSDIFPMSEEVFAAHMAFMVSAALI